MLVARLAPLLLLVAYGLVMWHFSAWRTRRELDARSTPLVDPALDTVRDRLAAALGVARIPVHLYEVDQVNGLAAPDGRIFLTRGFYQKFRAGEVSAEEIGGVIAHELGHVALGHSRRRMIDFTGQNALRAALTGLLGRLLPGFGALAAGLLASLLAARLSRRDEFEADAYATALLVKAGIGAGSQKSMLRKLEGWSSAAARSSGPAAWLMSHPAVPDRVAAIEENERRWGIAGAAADPGQGAGQ